MKRSKKIAYSPYNRFQRLPMFALDRMENNDHIERTLRKTVCWRNPDGGGSSTTSRDNEQEQERHDISEIVHHTRRKQDMPMRHNCPPPISLPKSAARLQILSVLNELHYKYKNLSEGDVANYIPELAKADPNWFAIAAVTMDGQVYEVGDYDQLFTIQSLSKSFVYGLALELHGRELVNTKVGVEPTGDAFNSIIKLDEKSKRPHNPMVNAGAIAMTDTIPGKDPADRLNILLNMFRKYTGEEVFVNMPVFLSERTTGHRNRAIAHLMRNFNMISEEINQTLDLYFQQCSIMVNCRHLAIMAATLANKGVNPITKEQAIHPRFVKDVLSVMYTCGLYDFAGEWAYKVGLPAKSGVSGGIVAVVPQQLGIGVFSPLLDQRGNSVRGIKVCEELSERFNLHIFDALMGESDFSDIVDSRPE